MSYRYAGDGEPEDAWTVEFDLASPAEEPGEELCQPARRLPGTARQRRIGAGALVLALVAVVVLRITSTHSTPPARAAVPAPSLGSDAAPGATPSAASTSGAGAPIPPPFGNQFSAPDPAPTVFDAPPVNLAPDQDPATCPVTIRCTTAAAVPAVVLTMLRARLPGFIETTEATTTEVAAHRLYYRQVTGDYRGQQLLVLLTRPTARPVGSRSETDDSPGLTTRLVTAALTGGLAVQVQVTGPPATTPAVEVLWAIAHDRRLLALD